MSHDPAEKTKIDRARQVFQSKQDDSLRALAAATSLQAAWRQKERLAAAGDSAVLAAKAAYEQAEKDLHAALSQERTARQAVVTALQSWLHASDPAQDVQTLAADTPITLFPVRIETRFKPAGNHPELWVRIYPDGIQADSHELWLTQAEWKAGEDYWRACWVENVATPEQQRKVELSAWRRWLQDFPAPRLAWIVEQTTPTNLSERGQPGKSPQFPAPGSNEIRPQGWTRPAQARLLPDRWLLVGYRGEREVLRAVSRPVVEPLALTFSPLSGLSSAADLAKDPDVGWAYDFDKAEQAGMAVRVRLAPEDRQGFDRLIVLGVKASLDAAQSRQALEQLFSAHRFTRGLALVAQGTPTNNTGIAPAGYPPPDPGGAQSYAVERGIVLPDTPLTDQDGHLFTAALGLPPSAASHLAGADRREQRHASNMNAALWPATLGYYVEQMLSPGQRMPGDPLPMQGLLSDREIETFKEYFVHYVHGRGPYPAFRVGSTPYGLLPVSALECWTPEGILPAPASPAPDLLFLQVQEHSDGNRGYLRLGQAVGAAGVHPAGWGAAQNFPGGFGPGTGCCGMCVADVDQDGQPDLLVTHVEDGKAFYRVGWRVDALGRVGAWSQLLPITGPSGSFGATTEAVGIAALDVDQDGMLDLLLFHQERSNATDPKSQAYYRVGRKLQSDGRIGQWEADQAIPDTPFPEDHPGSNIAVADFDRDGLPDLAVLQFGGEAGSPEVSKGFYRIGLGLDPSGSVQQWGGPIDIPGALNGRSWAGSLAIADLEKSGQLGLVVIWGEVLPGDQTARWFYQVARNLDAQGLPGVPGRPFNLPFDLAGTVGVGAALTRVRPSGWINMLRRLRRVWKAASFLAPHVQRDSADPDKDLLETLSMEASARQVRLRTTLGGDLLLNLYHYRGTGFFGIRDWQEWQSFRKEEQAQMREALGYPDWDGAPDPELLRLRLGEMVYDTASYGYRNPLVTDGALSETALLPKMTAKGDEYPNYIQFIASVSPDVLRKPERSDTDDLELLYVLLRHAMLLEYARATLEHAVRIGQVINKKLELREPELVGFFPPRFTAWERLLATDSSSSQPIWKLLAATGEFGLGEYRDRLRALVSLPTAELERLFTETLDVCSHRLDAWITSLATRRLELLRQNQKSSFIGAYGWVEDLRPQPAGSLTWETVQGNQALVQNNSGGHIHAPSMAHAATAAVLRNGYLTRSESTRKQYALDLSSERVRLAGWLLDGLRQGQSLSALLGYRFERGLHEQGLEQYIAPLRVNFPLVPPGPTMPKPAGQPQDPGTARNVVDGLALQKDEHRLFRNFVDQLPDQSDQSKLNALRNWLTDLLDAVSDLMLAEAVYQAVRGNTAAAVASLDAMAQGLRPPEPEIARSPRSGTSLIHRVAIVLGLPSTGEPVGWPSKKTPRAVAEPRLNNWVGYLLGDPRTVKCRVSVEVPTESGPDHLEPLQDVTLYELGLQPLDVLALAGSAGLTPAVSQLDQRVAYAALSQIDAPPGTEAHKVHIVYAPNPTWDRDRVRSFPEILELARAIHTVVGGAKPLAPADLLLPENTSLATQAIWQDEATDQRATQTLVALEATRAALDGAVTALEGSLKAYKEGPNKSLPNPQLLSQALVDAAGWGVTGALPGSAKNPIVDATQPEEQQAAARQRTVEQAEALLFQARGVQDEFARRLAQTKGIPLTDENGKPLKGAEWARAAAAQMKAVFGSDFVFLPAFRPVEAVAGELARALASGPQFDGADANQRQNRIRGWFQGAARVRPPLDRWRRMELYARSMRAGPAQFDLLQLPYKDGERWVGLEFGAEEQRPPSGRLSIALQRPSQLQAGDFWCGLLLDEWPEIIPNRSEVTGVAFHYDKPGAEAAHTVLLAVSPHTQGNWDLEELIAILSETLDLAHIRTVDSELVEALGQVAPAIFIAQNTLREADAEGISTDLSFNRFNDIT